MQFKNIISKTCIIITRYKLVNKNRVFLESLQLLILIIEYITNIYNYNYKLDFGISFFDTIWENVKH